MFVILVSLVMTAVNEAVGSGVFMVIALWIYVFANRAILARIVAKLCVLTTVVATVCVLLITSAFAIPILLESTAQRSFVPTLVAIVVVV